MSLPSAQRLVDVARTALGGSYDWGRIQPKDGPAWIGGDCAELVSWAAYQATGRLLGCSGSDPHTADAYSGSWAALAATLPELQVFVAPQETPGGYRVPLTVACATVGAVLVRAPQADLTGHVAISQGAGRTVEAYDTAHGVIESTSPSRRWDYGILLPGLAYVCQVAPVSPPVVIRVGARGEQVTQIQTRLNALGYPCGIDGVFGPATAHAVADVQRAHHAVADGEVGPVTRGLLGIPG